MLLYMKNKNYFKCKLCSITIMYDNNHGSKLKNVIISAKICTKNL